MQIQSIQTANLIWRRFTGSAANEIFLQCRPATGRNLDIAQQAISIYQALDSLLRRENGSLAQVVYETVFFRNIKKDFELFQGARLEVFRALAGESPLLPATTFIEQPPLDTDAEVVVSAIAVIPRHGTMAGASVASPACTRSFALGDQKYLFAGSICGKPGNAFEQAHSMFCLADEVLAHEGMNFRDVVRTWIYLKEMERDYGEFNRARREFFKERNVTLLPASTGIYGSPLPVGADFTLAFCAIRAPQPLETSAMTTPTLNEACTYGSDFSRGLRVVEANKVGLYISGTASVDEEGRTAHVDNFAGQVERMLLNVETLLAAQRASFRDVVSAFTYLKTPGDASVFHRILRERGLADMPNVLVHAAVCRSDLLCEMEAIAALPLP
jgi:enamine deaminase RidA (YjgF/YER057c/UK114 family)